LAVFGNNFLDDLRGGIRRKIIFALDHTSIEATVQAQKILTQIKIEHWLSKKYFVFNGGYR